MCGELRLSDAGKKVALMGWCNRRRDLGQIIFVDLRDRTGITQVVFNYELNAAVHEKAEALRNEFVIAAIGTVKRRDADTINPNIPTGEVELVVEELRILNVSKPLPFLPSDTVLANEEMRLKYRYIDLRRDAMQFNIELRHKVALAIRDNLASRGFFEIETPFMTRSTPEGARDYLVPSRVQPGSFYALPQSPQLFKQILMISGFDKYFQIVRCFRDEDLRADRQPEFTQLDLEMSFPRQQDIFDVIQQVMVRACAVAGIEVHAPFRHMEYREAIRRYGIDKPDLRFGMELCDVTPHFAAGLEKLRIEGHVQALVAPGAAGYSRKQLDELAERAKALGARGLYTVKVAAEGVTSPLEKTLGKAGIDAMVSATGAKPGDLIVAVSAAEQIPGTDTAALIAGQLRLLLAERLELVPKNRWEFLWLTGFPLFEWSTTEKRWEPAQHPFTGIMEDDVDKIESEPWNVRSKGYDLVLNGVELGSGSIRIHSQELQARIFRGLGMTDEQARQRFGFFLDALTYGTPPHGGIALGLDRVVALLAGEKSIREVIAFPKTTAGQDLMADAPSAVDADQLEVLGIALTDVKSRRV